MDLYAVLGVVASADAAALKSAHRAAVRRTHPDAGGDPGEFQQIQHAFEVLSDPVRRADYDRALRQVPPAPPGADEQEVRTASVIDDDVAPRPRTTRPGPVPSTPPPTVGQRLGRRGAACAARHLRAIRTVGVLVSAAASGFAAWRAHIAPDAVDVDIPSYALGHGVYVQLATFNGHADRILLLALVALVVVQVPALVALHVDRFATVAPLLVRAAVVAGIFLVLVALAGPLFALAGGLVRMAAIAVAVAVVGSIVIAILR
jgi:hypothetical protein